ncbi:putative NTP binding protein [Mizugakiibacter sediminis]|uniref:Putative NTP binding protein n=1 Tax=Mizugakiibacter sediminis TaxID=1475481 RepID=A0A0K8QML2_9GAMM|nr:STAS domain-containing protein [Mizugakiibacter sediminis]GAP66124.1 putative NTP binding protein [Mizugakiibacter sediminis]
MADAALQVNRHDDGTLALSGALTFATAAGALRQAGAALADGAPARLDLGGVQATDSAGLACVLALLARARRAGRALTVTNLPPGLRALARVCEVEALLDAA